MIDELNRLNEFFNSLQKDETLADQQAENERLEQNIIKLVEQNRTLRDDIESQDLYNQNLLK